jgi:cytoskeleton protein RodZ
MSEQREAQRAGAGAMLSAAREALGLSVDAVAQQLKLSAGQVRALEDGQYGLLPGRTFVRGFVRNYARLVRLDAEQVLDALPSGAAMPTLEAPTLHPTAPSMGELPTSERPKASWTRWAIPASLAAIVAVAAVYEWARPAAASRPHPPARDANAPAEAPTTPARAEKSETPLPNPLQGSASVAASPKEDAPAAPAQAVTPAPEPAQTQGAAKAP